MEMPDSSSQGQDQKGTILVFLALYLLLLTVFIVLVSMSTLEEQKTSAAMESLSATFSSDILLTGMIGPGHERSRTNPAGQAFQDQVIEASADLLKVARLDVIEPGKVMSVTFPVDLLFYQGEDRLRETRYPFLDRLIALISSRPDKERYDMEFIIGSPKTDDPGILSVESTLEMKRTSTFARTLLDRGFPLDSLAVGMRAGFEDEIVMVFFVRKQNMEKIRHEVLKRLSLPTTRP